MAIAIWYTNNSKHFRQIRKSFLYNRLFICLINHSLWHQKISPSLSKLFSIKWKSVNRTHKTSFPSHKTIKPPKLFDILTLWTKRVGTEAETSTCYSPLQTKIKVMQKNQIQWNKKTLTLEWEILTFYTKYKHNSPKAIYHEKVTSISGSYSFSKHESTLTWSRLMITFIAPSNHMLLLL